MEKKCGLLWLWGCATGVFASFLSEVCMFLLSVLVPFHSIIPQAPEEAAQSEGHHAGPVRSIAAAEKVLVTGSDDQCIHVWCIHNGIIVPFFAPPPFFLCSKLFAYLGGTHNQCWIKFPHCHQGPSSRWPQITAGVSIVGQFHLTTMTSHHKGDSNSIIIKGPYPSVWLDIREKGFFSFHKVVLSLSLSF